MFRMGAASATTTGSTRRDASRCCGARRTMAAPFRRTVAGALVFIGAVDARRLVVGPLLVRYGIDHGIDEGDARCPAQRAVIAYIVVVDRRLPRRPPAVRARSTGPARGSCAILRVRVFDHIQRQSLAFFDRNKSGVLVARMTADIESMGELVQFGLLQFVSAAILLVFSLVLLFVLSWQLALVGLLVLPIIIVASRKFQRDSNAAYLDVRENVGQNLSTLQEGIAGVRVIQAYAREPEQRRRFRDVEPALFDSHVHSVRVSTWYFGLVEFCGVFATALVDRRRRVAGATAATSRSARSSPSCCCSPACSSRCSSSRSCTTPCSRRPRR